MGAVAVAAVALVGALSVGGTAQAAAPADAAACNAAVFHTGAFWGSGWHGDADLTMLIGNRRTIIDHNTVTAGTHLTWTNPNGNADITFAAGGSFTGTAQFYGEGPVRYRGNVK